MMKPLLTASLAALTVLGVALGAIGSSAAPTAPPPQAPVYDDQGRLAPPPDYREWVYLSSGVDMSYSSTPAMADAHMFDNVFAPLAAYRTFKATGVWPDKTVLILESRGAASKGSINKLGLYQTGALMGIEAHVKDGARFKGGWGFFAFSGANPSPQIPYSAACYACHQSHAAADTTFVQFYPTLLGGATRLDALSPSYLAEEAAAKAK